MTPEYFKKLKVGDLVRHKADHRAYTITGKTEHGYTAVREITVTNPMEWDHVHPGGARISDD